MDRAAAAAAATLLIPVHTVRYIRTSIRPSKKRRVIPTTTTGP